MVVHAQPQVKPPVVVLLRSFCTLTKQTSPTFPYSGHPNLVLLTKLLTSTGNDSTDINIKPIGERMATSDEHFSEPLDSATLSSEASSSAVKPPTNLLDLATETRLSIFEYAFLETTLLATCKASAEEFSLHLPKFDKRRIYHFPDNLPITPIAEMGLGIVIRAEVLRVMTSNTVLGLDKHSPKDMSGLPAGYANFVRVVYVHESFGGVVDRTVFPRLQELRLLTATVMGMCKRIFPASYEKCLNTDWNSDPVRD